MKTNDYASYELAVKLKAARFDEPCLAFYDANKELGRALDPDNFNHLGETYQGEWFTDTISAPSLYHAQKWLREKKNWHIIVEPIIWESLTYEFKLWHKFRGYENANRGFYFSSYERALSAGISAALELIKEGE